MGAAAKDSGLAAIFGGGKTPPLGDSEPDEGEAAPASEKPTTDEPSEAFKTAVQETGLSLDDEQTSALWRAIKECAGSY